MDCKKKPQETDKKPNSYELSRAWFDFCFENPEKISPKHSAIYFFAIEHCNRLGWKQKFGFPSLMTMEALGIKKHQTYIKAFYDLVEWGFFVLIQKSTNQYSANIISLARALPKNSKALDNAIIKHRAKQGQSTGQSTGQSKVHINKPINQLTNKPINQLTNIFVLELCKLYKRRESTEWDLKEKKKLNEIIKRSNAKEELEIIVKFYNSGYEYTRKDIITLLNNWTGELDKANNNTLSKHYKNNSVDFDVELSKHMEAIG
jgi:hypothetical protein